MARWRILASDAHTLHDVDLILGLGSLRSTFKLALRPFSPGAKWSLKAILCLGWMAFICAINIAISLLGLTYSVDEVANFGFEPGYVSIADLKHYYPNNGTTKWESGDEGVDHSTESFMANLYGIASYNYKHGRASDDLPRDEYWLEQYLNGSWKYHFHDLDYYGGLNVRTNRFITTNQNCTSHKIQNITKDWQTFWYSGSVSERTEQRTLQELLPNFTTYALRPDWSCDRCRSIDVVQLTSAAQNWTTDTQGDVGYFFECSLEVGPIFNPKVDNHILKDRQARIAAGAIANRGWVNENGFSYFHYRDPVGPGLYLDGNETAMENLLSRFAVGVVASLDRLNPREFVFDEHRPFQGNKLNVIWRAFYTQLVSSIFVIWFSNPVIVKDSSYISIGRLLRPAIDTLGNCGNITTGDEISRAFKSKLVYGIRTRDDGLMNLDLNVDIYPSKAFTDGWYN
ncbi:hypothetical protein TWF281_010569 [Arthrobotrys megalospora]